MKAKFLVLSLCMMAPMAANADIKYRVENIARPVNPNSQNVYTASFAAQHRFYAGAMYDLSLWDAWRDENGVLAGGKSSSSFEAVLGVRPYDIFRVELNYAHTDARWSDFSLIGETAMVNALVDARVGSLYRLFYHQRIVPYVGVGAGVSWNRVGDDADISIEHKFSPTVAALAGVGFELGEWFTVDLGYKYFYMFTPEFSNISGLNPTAHQFRAGVRFNF